MDFWQQLVPKNTKNHQKQSVLINQSATRRNGLRRVFLTCMGAGGPFVCGEGLLPVLLREFPVA